MRRAVVIIGPPGGGKTTQARKLASVFDFTVFDAGEVIGAAVQHRSELRALRESGALLPSEVVNEIVVDELKLRSRDRRIVCVGYPRQIGQVPGLIEWFEAFPLVCPAVVCLDAGEATIRRRLIERHEQQVGAGRVDGTPKAIDLRVEEFHRHHTATIRQLEVDLFRYNRSRVRFVDAEQSEDRVFVALMNAIESAAPVV